MGVNASKFVGKGMIFPLQIENGGIKVETGIPLIQSSIKMILEWSIGTRFFLGEFGSFLPTLLEEQNSNLLKNVIETYVVDPLKRWEPRIEKLEAQVIEVNDNTISLNITYRIITTQQDDSFIVPFIRDIIY